jgi:uncharacterized alkaline shock family protein YloU
MNNLKQKPETRKLDRKELELPDTLFVRDIENRVFQGIVYQCLSKVEGISLVEGNFIDNFFDRGSLEGVKGIYAEQDSKNTSVSVKIEVNILYGYSIPEKAEEIQILVAEEIMRLTGLHVSNVHVIFKNVVSELPKPLEDNQACKRGRQATGDNVEDEFNEEF